MVEANVLDLLVPILDDVSNGVTVADATDPQMPLIFVNKAFERVTGHKAEDVLGQNCRFLQGKGSDGPDLERLRSAIRAGESCHVLLRNYRKDQTAFLNELKMKPVRNADGALTHFIGIQNDVTSVLVARALQRSLEKSSKDSIWKQNYNLGLPEVSRELRRPPEVFGVAVCDHRGQLRYANPTFARMVKQPPEKLHSTSVFEHLDCDWLSEALISEELKEHEWFPALLMASGNQGIDLSHYRVVPDLSSSPWHVLLVRPSELASPGPVD